IEKRLDQTPHKVPLSLELNASSVSTAVSIYVREKVHLLAANQGYDAQTTAAVQDHLSSHANDTFLWVALVCQALEDVSCWRVLARLNDFPAGLNALYQRMLGQILQIKDRDDLALCKQILAIASTVYRPIT